MSYKKKSPPPIDSQGFFTHKRDIEAWLKKHEIKLYKILEDLTVDVIGEVFLNGRKLKTIPVHFHKVEGNFNCHNNQLENLLFAPKFLQGSFYGSGNFIKSLEGLPPLIEGDVLLQHNQLENLLFLPDNVEGDFHLHGNPLLGDIQQIFDFSQIKEIATIQEEKNRLEKTLELTILAGETNSRPIHKI